MNIPHRSLNLLSSNKTNFVYSPTQMIGGGNKGEDLITSVNDSDNR